MVVAVLAAFVVRRRVALTTMVALLAVLLPAAVDVPPAGVAAATLAMALAAAVVVGLAGRPAPAGAATLPAGAVVAGVPARFLRFLNEEAA